MNDQEKKALLQFMGQVYGDTKRHDDMLVSSSTNLRPKSNEIKNAFEQTLKANTQPTAPAPRPAEPAPVVTPAIVEPDQAIKELATEPVPENNNVPVQSSEESNSAGQELQLELDLVEQTKLEKVIELLERQTKLLSNINNSIQELTSKKDLINKQTKLPSKRNGKSISRKEPK